MNRKLILLHGALGTDEQMIPLAGKLASHFEIHNLLFNGHGNVQAGNAFDIDLLAQQLISTMKGNRALVFGYSMGGYVALAAMARQPELFEGVITLGTKFDWSAETLVKELRQLQPEKITEKVPRLASLLEERHGVNWPMLVLQTAGMMRLLGDQYRNFESTWTTMNKPVLMLLGDQDMMVTQDESLRVAEILPNVTFKILPDTPHQIERINMEMLAAEVLDFSEALTS